MSKVNSDKIGSLQFSVEDFLDDHADDLRPEVLKLVEKAAEFLDRATTMQAEINENE